MSRWRLSTLALACGLGLARPAQAPAQVFLGKPARAWMAELHDPRPEVRRSAAFALGKVGAATPGATTALLRCLKNEGEEAPVRELAASALGEIARSGPEGDPRLWKEAGPALENCLARHPDARVRRSAAFALGAFASLALPAQDTILAALKDKEAGVRQNAAWALGRLSKGPRQRPGDGRFRLPGEPPPERRGTEDEKKAVAGLCAALADADPLVRRDAAAALGEIGPPAAREAVRPLLGLAKTEADEVVLKTALDKLINLVGPDDAPAAETLYPFLEREDPETGRLAAFVLANMGGPAASPALKVLAEALADEDPAVQRLAAASLGNLGRDAASAAPALARALAESKDTYVRRNAALALTHMGADAHKAVPELIQALKVSEFGEVRVFAAEAVARIGLPYSEKAFPTLLKIIRDDPDPEVRHRCVWAFQEVEDLERYGAVGPLTEAMNTPGRSAKLLRYEAAVTLAEHLRVRAPARTVDVLLDFLKDAEILLYDKTEAKVSSAGTETGTGQSEIRDKHKGDARFHAARGLGLLGPLAANRDDVVKALQEAARDMDPRLRESAKQALDRLGK